jgi:hypothetical protein
MTEFTNPTRKLGPACKIGLITGVNGIFAPTPSEITPIRGRRDAPHGVRCSRPLSHLRDRAQGRRPGCLRAVVRRPGRLLAAVARKAKEFPAPAGLSSATRTDFRLLPSYGRSGRFLSGLSSRPPFGSRSSVPGFLLRCPVRGERKHSEHGGRPQGSPIRGARKERDFSCLTEIPACWWSTGSAARSDLSAEQSLPLAPAAQRAIIARPPPTRFLLQSGRSRGGSDLRTHGSAMRPRRH